MLQIKRTVKKKTLDGSRGPRGCRKAPGNVLCVSVGGGGCSGYSYEFDLSDEPIDPDMDLVFTKDGSRVGKITDKIITIYDYNFSYR